MTTNISQEIGDLEKEIAQLKAQIKEKIANFNGYKNVNSYTRSKKSILQEELKRYGINTRPGFNGNFRIVGEPKYNTITQNETRKFQKILNRSSKNRTIYNISNLRNQEKAKEELSRYLGTHAPISLKSLLGRNYEMRKKVALKHAANEEYNKQKKYYNSKKNVRNRIQAKMNNIDKLANSVQDLNRQLFIKQGELRDIYKSIEKRQGSSKGISWGAVEQAQMVQLPK